MIPRIREVKPLPGFCLRVVFDDGKTVIYPVMEDIEQIESYRDLLTVTWRRSSCTRRRCVRAAIVCPQTPITSCILR